MGKSFINIMEKSPILKLTHYDVMEYIMLEYLNYAKIYVVYMLSGI